MSQRDRWHNQGRYGLDNREALPLHRSPHARQPASAALRAYWDGLRGHRRAPHRRELRPASLGPALSNTFVLEKLGDDRAVYRLAGGAIFDLFQRELRGLEWLTLFDEGTRPRAQACASRVLSDGTGILLHVEGRTARHRVVPLEILLLPLAADAGEQQRALGSIDACDRPYWLGAQPIVELTVVAVEALSGETPEPPARRAAWPWRGPIRRLRHLALYLGGDGAQDTHR